MNATKNRRDRVVFFSKEDLARTNMLTIAESILDNSHGFLGADINDLLEFYHIKLYFNNGVFLSAWTSEKRSTYLLIANSAFCELRSFFVKMDVEAINELIETLDFHYRESFWQLFSLFETYKRMARGSFSTLLNVFPSHTRYILTIKPLVHHFNNEIRNWLLLHPESAEILLSHFEEKHTHKGKEYFFPKSLSQADMYSIVSSYLESDKPNLNYVDLARNSKHLKLPPKLLLKAKLLSESIKDEYLTDENSTRVSVEATLDMNQSEPLVYEKIGMNTNVTYGGAFFDTLDDDIQLFSVFSDVFLYINEEGLINLINKDVDVDNFEKIFMRSKNEYITGFVFSKKDMLSMAQLEVFNAYLKKKGRSIEQLIENFVQQCMCKRFNMDDLVFKMPDPCIEPSDKIRLLAPELEYLLKQYKSLVSEGIINHDLLQIDSNPIFYNEIPSLVKKRYVTSTHQTILMLQYQFFDHHGILSERAKETNSKNLFTILTTEKLIKSDLEGYQQEYITFLEKEGVVRLDAHGVIELIDPLLIFIAGRLRENGALGYWRYPIRIREKVDEMIQANLLQCNSSLFTTDEISYISYYLNRREFTNGQDLRNKYLHGSNNRKLDVQQTDYRCFLRIVILVLLKLRDDLELNAALSMQTDVAQ
jgi:hypothetical protein